MRLLFSPDEDSKKNTNLSRFLDFVNHRYEFKLKDYWSLHDWSTKDLGGFWSSIWEFCGVIGTRSGSSYVGGINFWESQFFPESQLNFAENLIMRGKDEDLAVSGIDESGKTVDLSRLELRNQVGAVASALRALGMQSGDRVVAWSSNTVETTVFALGALSIGAIVSTCSPDFAPNAVIDRFGQIRPKVLLASPSYNYAGKSYSRFDELNRIVEGLPTLEEIIVVSKTAGSANFKNWDEWISNAPNQKLEFEKFSFNHPCFILFSSGTTGKPKCIVHKSGGVLLKLLSEHLLHLDIRDTSKVLYYTTTGWMMWNWLLGTLATGSTLVLYDGSPTYPQTHNLMTVVEQMSITHLGISPRYVELLKQEKDNSLLQLKLTALARVISTGSPLSSDCFEFLYNSLPQHVVTTSISGGTDLCGCFLNAIPTEPVYAGEIQGPALGFDMDVLGDDGEDLNLDVKGELVCKKPFPSVPLGFWGDSDNVKFQSSYFEKYPGVWTHGDFASKTHQGGFIIHGRSDATLNSRGVRIGTAEIYSVVDALPEVSESLAISKSIEDETFNVLFVVLRSGHEFSANLQSRIRNALRTSASPRHVPDFIFEAPELPRTKSNKLVEIPVTDLVNGRRVRDLNSLKNPDSLKWFERFSANELFLNS